MQYDAVVIGGGQGGYIAALRLAQLGKKTACIDENQILGMKGIGAGSIPSKTLLHSSELYSRFKEEAKVHGINLGDRAFNFPALMDKKAEVMQGLSDELAELLQKHGVELIAGRAEVIDGNTIAVQKQKGKKEIIKAGAIILATGSRSRSLPNLPFDEKKILSPAGALQLNKLPKSILMVGGGISGLELASVYSRLGSHVTVVEQLPSICPMVDKTVTDILFRLLKKQGIHFMLNSLVVSGKDIGEKGVEIVLVSQKGHETKVAAEAVIVAIGRRPNSENLGLSRLNIGRTIHGAIVVDTEFRTAIPTIFAIGDLIEGPMVAHRASAEAIAVAEIIAGLKPDLDYTLMPNVLYTSPEVAVVGLSEEEAKAAKQKVLIGTCSFYTNHRARCTGETDGVVKVVADSASHRIIGIHILAPAAAEMAGAAVIALYKKFTLDELASVPFAYPTFSEALKEASRKALGRSLYT